VTRERAQAWGCELIQVHQQLRERLHDARAELDGGPRASRPAARHAAYSTAAMALANWAEYRRA
jgi:hypothetical protein